MYINIYTYLAWHFLRKIYLCKQMNECKEFKGEVNLVISVLN